jgi:hypothetical protein
MVDFLPGINIHGRRVRGKSRCKPGKFLTRRVQSRLFYDEFKKAGCHDFFLSWQAAQRNYQVIQPGFVA